MWRLVRKWRRPELSSPVDPEKFLDDVVEHNVGTYKNDKQRLQDFKKTFGTPEGRRVLYWIMMWAQVFSSAPEGSNLDRVEGARDIAYRILHILNARVDESGRDNERDSD